MLQFPFHNPSRYILWANLRVIVVNFTQATLRWAWANLWLNFEEQLINHVVLMDQLHYTLRYGIGPVPYIFISTRICRMHNLQYIFKIFAV